MKPSMGPKGIHLLLKSGLVAASCILAAHLPLPAQSEQLKLFDFWQFYSDAPNALYKGMVTDAMEQIDRRKQQIAALSTSADWTRRQSEIRSRLAEIVGPFPEKTPLNAQIMSTHRKEGYRIENVLYESQPGFFVTASLFLPDQRQEPAPAILFCSGHSVPGYRSAAYQRMILNLVKKGFIVLAFDPIGQGERMQYFDPAAGESTVARGSTSRGHSYAGTQTFITGVTLARQMIWDGIRSVDYLVSRKEVDPDRLGITGRSGGGTQTAYIAAFDDRLLAAAPECYITTFEHLLISRGPQDAEQNFHRGIASGMDQADLLAVRAPKPALIVATTRDIFSFEGTLSVFAELKQAYRAFGQEDKVRLASDDNDHVNTRKNREALHAFFQEALGMPGDPGDEEIELLDLDELRVTPSGQVSTSFDGEDVLSLNHKEVDRLMNRLTERRKDLASHLPQVKSDAARLSGYRPATGTQPSIFAGRYIREGYFIDKYLIPVNQLYAIPVLVMVPEVEPRPQAVLHLHPEGKAAAVLPGGETEQLVKQGYTVIAPDVIGIGELSSGYVTGGEGFPNISLNRWFGFASVGRSIVGVQIADVMRTLDLARGRLGIDPENIYAIAYGTEAPLLLHTAAIEEPFAGIALLDPLLSYRTLATTRSYLPEYVPSAVPAALTAYDLPDLAASLAPNRLLLVNVSDAAGNIAGPDLLAQDLAVVHAAYDGTSPSSGVTLLHEPDTYSLMEALTSWLE